MPRKPHPVELVDDQVGNRLRRLRRGKGWTPDEAVAEINALLPEGKTMTKRGLGSWERGERRPPLGPKIRATAQTYGVTLDFLLVGEE